MLELIAQTYDSYSSGASSGAADGLFTGMFLAVILFAAMISFALMVAGMWKIFEKAGVEGWKAIIPGYNAWILAEIAGKPGWWGIVGFAGVVPIVGFIAGIAAFVLNILIMLELAKRFGKDTTFAIVGLILFQIIGLLILGFGDAQYQGDASQVTTQPAQTPFNNAPMTAPTQPTVNTPPVNNQVPPVEPPNSMPPQPPAV